MSQKENIKDVIPMKEKSNVVSSEKAVRQTSNSVCIDCFFCEHYNVSCKGGKICKHHSISER